MKELFTQYSISEIVIFSLILAIFVKEAVSVIKFFKGEFDYTYGNKQKKEEQIKFFTNEIAEIRENFKQINSRLDAVSNSIILLTESDKDDIKGWIVSQYHKFMAQGWIDDFTMDTLEKRYSHYVEEGGNSYIETLMNELRELPKKK